MLVVVRVSCLDQQTAIQQNLQYIYIYINSHTLVYPSIKRDTLFWTFSMKVIPFHPSIQIPEAAVYKNK